MNGRNKKRHIAQAFKEHGPMTSKDLYLALPYRYKRNLTSNEIFNILHQVPDFVIVGHISPYGNKAKLVPIWDLATEEE